jgi:hypothetical protein
MKPYGHYYILSTTFQWIRKLKIRAFLSTDLKSLAMYQQLITENKFHLNFYELQTFGSIMPQSMLNE